MENIDIIQLWKNYDSRLEESITLNKKNAVEILKLKTKSALTSMRPVKLFATIVGILWVLAGTIILSSLAIHAFDRISLFFFFSAALQVLITAIAIAIYIYQVILISRVDIGEPVLTTQKTLTSLTASSLWVAKILILQLPLWTTFYITSYCMQNSGLLYYLINGACTAIFTFAAGWLFFNIRFENRDKKWFRILFNDREWAPLMRSMEMLAQLKEYEEVVATGNDKKQ
ncbi:hypothetical protein [Ferruginibacter sp. HRS2-29]|uniref:hypothetical protein n=1 Tax=Ferruginibacter sp. HRS2-29 TaxID=2487334 RepID=UPI0020CE913A|nr:hypothetical protein [Ferruginibacter sp. HRS2-29]MCP9750951.1 hypothetical protein [Ferruginibacter sp. HRS2-29]